MVPWGILVIINVPEPIERQSFRSADACEIQDLTPVAARVTPPRGGRGTGDGATPQRAQRIARRVDSTERAGALAAAVA